MNTDERKRLNINVARETKELLDSVKHRGQSYNGLIRELLEFWRAAQTKETTEQAKGGDNGNSQ